jgi:hypothetical protein
MTILTGQKAADCQPALFLALDDDDFADEIAAYLNGPAFRALCGVRPEGIEPEIDEAAPSRRKPHDPNGLLTMAQAAARLGITIEQVKAHVDDGALRYVNVGRGKKRPRYRFTPVDLDEFIANRTMQEQPCRSIAPKRTEASTSSTSRSKVIGFTARRAALLAAKPKRSKP